MKVSEVIVKYITSLEITNVFGVPGGAIDSLCTAFSNETGINQIIAKHEQGAVFMADAYTRVSGKIGVCFSTTGPGSTNMYTGIASSKLDGTPLLIITAQVPLKLFGKGAIQDSTQNGIDIIQGFKSCTKYSDMIHSVDQVHNTIQRAVRFALTNRQGPVHLNIPADILESEISDSEKIPLLREYVSESKTYDRYRTSQAAKLILASKKIIVIAGYGIHTSDAKKELQDFCEYLGIGMVSSPKGKGVLREDHPQYIGIYGIAGHERAAKYIRESDIDLAIVVGTSFNEWGSDSWDINLDPAKGYIQIDIDPYEIGKNYKVAVGIQGDAQVVLRELLYEIKRQLNKEGKSLSCRQLESVKKYITDNEIFSMDKYRSEHVKIKPQRLMKDLNDSCPADTIFTIDAGNNLLWAIHYLFIKEERQFITSLGFASMGYGVPAAIGAKLAHPKKTVISIVGDGGFLMNGLELAAAVWYKVPIIVIVENNAEYGMVKHGRKLRGIEHNVGGTFQRIDFAKLAESLGAKGISITEPGQINKELIDCIVSSNTPTLLDVIIDEKEEPPMKSRVKTLRHPD